MFAAPEAIAKLARTRPVANSLSIMSSLRETSDSEIWRERGSHRPDAKTRRRSIGNESILRDGVYRAAPLALVILAWEAYSRISESVLIPGSLEILGGVLRLLTSAEVGRAFLVSNQAFGVGLLVSLAVGVPCGMLMGRLSRIDRLLDPFVNLLLVTPTAPLIPLIVIALGFDLPARVLLVVMFVLPFIVVNARTGMRDVQRSLREVCACFGASEAQTWRFLLFPGSLNGIFTGIRIGIARGVEAMVATELLMVALGIGALTNQFRARLEFAELFALMILIVGESLILIAALRSLSARWKERFLIAL